jgi:hypothetical protein
MMMKCFAWKHVFHVSAKLHALLHVIVTMQLKQGKLWSWTL